MRDYPYLVSSLPALALGSPAPFSPQDFLFHCQGALAAEDLAEIAAVLEGRAADGHSAAAQEWAAVEAQVRNAAAKVRGTRLGVEAKPFLKPHRGYRVWLDKEVADALAKPNPLQAEMALDAVRWKAADDIAQQDARGLGAVVAFAAKLTLVARWAQMDDAAGRAKLDGLVEDLEKGAADSGAVSFK